MSCLANSRSPRLVSSLDTGLARAQRRRKASRSQTEPAVCGEGERDLCERERELLTSDRESRDRAVCVYIKQRIFGGVRFRGRKKLVEKQTTKREHIRFLCFCVFIFSWKRKKNVYDPSAGSPTETLLRLLLPLKDQVRPSFSLAVGRRRTGRDCSPLDGTPTSPSEGLTKSFNR